MDAPNVSRRNHTKVEDGIFYALPLQSFAKIRILGRTFFGRASTKKERISIFYPRPSSDRSLSSRRDPVATHLRVSALTSAALPPSIAADAALF